MKIHIRIARKIYLFYLHIQHIRFKSKKTTTDPIIHYYTVCWNEEDMLPFVFDYYDSFVDHYYVYDNGSSDSTIQILKKRNNVTILPFETNNEFNELVNQKIKNNCWKQSRGKADWVIVCDVDEFIYHPEGIVNLLQKNKNKTIFKPQGYEMCSEKFPQKTKPLLQQVRYGYKSSWYNKLVIFNPYKIIEIDYEPGSHSANPKGIVNYCNDSDFKLLHFKKLSVDYLIKRYTTLKLRYNKENSKKGMGNHYQHDIEKIKEDFKQELQKTEKVL